MKTKNYNKRKQIHKYPRVFLQWEQWKWITKEGKNKKNKKNKFTMLQHRKYVVRIHRIKESDTYLVISRRHDGDCKKKEKNPEEE